MQPAEIRQLLDYSYWVDTRLFANAAQVSPEQLQQDTGHSFGTLYNTLAHMHSARWVWRQRLQSGTSPSRLHTGDDFADLAALRVF